MAGQGTSVDGEETFRSPLGVTADEDAPENCVRVQVVFPGLLVSRRPVFQGFKVSLEPQPSNGTVDVKFYDRSLAVVVVVKQKKTEKKFKYEVKQLPDEIDPSLSSFKLKKEQVIMYLYKKKSRSWARELSDTGLETYEEETN